MISGNQHGDSRTVSGIWRKKRFPVKIEHFHERLDYVRVVSSISI